MRLFFNNPKPLRNRGLCVFITFPYISNIMTRLENETQEQYEARKQAAKDRLEAFRSANELTTQQAADLRAAFQSDLDNGKHFVRICKERGILYAEATKMLEDPNYLPVIENYV